MDTSIIKLYLLASKYSDSDLSSYLCEECEYTEHEVDERIQNKKDTFIWCYIKPNKNTPDWYSLIRGYLLTGKDLFFQSHDMVMIITHVQDSGVVNNYVITGGSGYHDIAKYIDFSFGIKILEKIFDPVKNKIESVSDKGIIGDVLASIRYYRKGRYLAYEDDFGKYFQKIIVRLDESQIEEHFPTLHNENKRKKKQLVVTGSTCIEIRRKVNLAVIVDIAKGISSLLEKQTPSIFNKSLQALSTQRDSSQIKVLNELILVDIIESIKGTSKAIYEYDFCHRDFQEFYTSSTITFFFRPINVEYPKKEIITSIEYDDFSCLRNMSFLDDLFELLKNSREYKESSEKDSLLLELARSISVATKNEANRITTTGSFIEYLQVEKRHDNKSYFLLDNNWFILLEQFDSTLTDKYISRVSSKITDYSFLPKWGDGINEDEYNSNLGKQSQTYCLHKVFSEYIELCDGIYTDKTNNTTYILHAKDGIGTQMRELVSQVFLSARIIEEEVRTSNFKNISAIYHKGIKGKYSDGKAISEKEFISLFSDKKREYCMLIKGQSYNRKDIIDGNFSSRIAKFSLFEYSVAMIANEWKFGISIL